MIKRIFLILTLAIFLSACSENYPEEHKLLVASLAPGQSLPKELQAAEVYGGVIFVGPLQGWFVRDGKVMYMDGNSYEMSPGLEMAPYSVIEAAFENSDLSWLKENPPAIPAHLNIYHNDFYDEFSARMPEDLVQLDNEDNKKLKLEFGQKYDNPMASYYIEIGDIEAEEVGGWVTKLNLTVYYSHKQSDIEEEFNKVADLAIATVFDLLSPDSPDSNQELRDRLFKPIFNKEVDEVEYMVNGYKYKSWRGEAETHPDFQEREYVHMSVTAAE